MADDNCCVSGGRVVITANGQRWSSRTAANIEWTDTQRDIQTNQDGTLAVTFKAKAPSAKFSLSDNCGLDLDTLKNCKLDVTFDLIDARRKFFFSGAIMTGRPSLNTETGEISGIEIVSQKCRTLRY